MSRRTQRCLMNSVAIIGAGVFAAGQLQAAEEQTLAQALSAGKTTVNFRLRSEQVDDDLFTRSAHAGTLRSRLTYGSAAWQGWDLNLELDHVAHVSDDKFNSTRNSKPFLPQIPDPDGADLNQANLRYRQGAATFTVGRQRLLRDNQRFVGGVGWRQNEQTYDAASVAYKVSEEVQIDYAWVNSTRRIFGPDAGNPPPALDSNHHLLNAAWQVNSGLRAGAYLYALEFDDSALLSSNTAGVFVQGTSAQDGFALDYRLEVARQQDNKNNPRDYSTDYYLGSVGTTFGVTKIAAAYEVLGADASANVAMQTPLATLHAFQGWADKFLTTPANGMRDTYISAQHKIGKVDLMAVWHDYKADRGGASYGSEWNLQASTSINANLSLMLKYADYQADKFGTDAQKLWVMAEARF
ncbi:MAG: alginate export family protein [Pseudohongiella sp.]|nr:alginate export family protein [Pseudohongiella sp.]